MVGEEEGSHEEVQKAAQDYSSASGVSIVRRFLEGGGRMSIDEKVAKTVKAIMAENKHVGKPLYSFRPIPCEIDRIAGEFVRMFMQAPSAERRQISAAVPAGEGAFLIHFAQRMAALGVREQSRERILEGLVALIIEDYKEDFRDNIIRLGPLYDAALKIAVDPQALFNEAAAYLNNAPARDILEFPLREPDDRSLDAMGFKESSDADGFKYERTW